MHVRGRGGHHHNLSGSVSKTQQLANAYQELGKQLESKDIRQVGNYSLGRIIGEGTFGKVRLAVHRLTSTRCAVKQIPRHLAPSALTREIHHHRRLHHPHVVQLYEVIATEQHIWLVSELCPGGELFDYLVEHGRLTETETKRIFGQLCLAVAYIHAQGVVHRDLKLENVLLDERCNVKVADFGFGREFESRKLMETFCGSVGYSAPEMLAGRKYTGEEVDLWSLGIILYTLLCGSLPFDDDDEEVMKAKIIKGFYELPDFLSADACDLISGIMQLDPRDRFSIRQILSHAWFTRTPPVPDVAYDLLPPVIPEDHEIVESPEDETPTRPSEIVQPAPVEAAASDASMHSTRSSDSSLSRSQTSRATTPLTSEDGGTSPISLDAIALASLDKEVTPLQRQSSDATLTQGYESEERSNSFRNVLPTHAEHDDGPEQHATFRFPSNPGLASHHLTDSLPASPMLPTHSRTPARTKRRSVSSSLSERLLLPYDGPALPDYLALLSETMLEPLSTPAEKALLASLTSLGFDTGQMTHSVRSHACDASGATWWMLKRKSDERDAEARELAASRSPSSDTFRRARTSMTPTLASRHTVRIGETTFRADSPATSSQRSLWNESPPESNAGSPTRLRSLTVPASQGIPLSVSTPTFSSAASTTPISARKSTGNLPNIHLSPAVVNELNVSTSSLDSNLSDSAKAKRAEKKRSASVSMLSRAFSSSPGAGSEGRSTPTSQLAGLFSRKSLGTLMGEKSSKEALRNLSAEALGASASASTITTPSKSSGLTPIGSPSVDAFPVTLHSPALVSSLETQSSTPSLTSDLQHPDATTSKLRSRGSLFSNFKLWFNEDRRKRKRPAAGLGLTPTASFRASRSPTRTMSRSAQPAGSYAHPASRRPPMHHRRSSQTTSLPSRRSSIASSHGGPSGAKHIRRSSASSRASHGTSTPPSRSASFMSDGRPRQHHKTGSHSSAGSKHSGGLVASPGQSYRRTPTSTHVQVRRVSTSQMRRRPVSSASSIRTVSSRRSSISEDGKLDADLHRGVAEDQSIIEEEPESQGEETVEYDRQTALAALSGEAVSSRRSPSMRSNEQSPGPARRPNARHTNATTIFTAHKSTHLFSGPVSRGFWRPKLRDVFARSPTGDDDWEDEAEDHLTGFARGFGQAAESPSSTTLAAAGAFKDDRGGSLLGEGRYAGVMPKGDSAPWRSAKSTGPQFKTVVIEEDEEED